jgi:plasmid stabilization system protein ParE
MSAAYFLSPRAARDLADIWWYVKESSSEETADRVETAILKKIEFLAEFPGAGHSRKDLTDKAVKFFSVYSYLIVYRSNESPLQIAAILHGRRNVGRILNSPEPSTP